MPEYARFLAALGLAVGLLFGSGSLARADQPFNMEKTVKDLTEINNALAKYYKDHQSYPKTGKTLDVAGWDGLHTSWGKSSPAWISGLVPKYLKHLPRDTRMTDDPTTQYMYRSDGKDYKLISHRPLDPECHIRTLYPTMLDPARDCWAFGFWSKGAAGW